MKRVLLFSGISAALGCAMLATPVFAQGDDRSADQNEINDLSRFLNPSQPSIPVPSAAQAVRPPIPAAAANCFDVVVGSGDQNPGPILIDHCNGKTWLLVRDPISGAKGGPATASAYRWHPLSYDNRESMIAPPPTHELAPIPK